MLCKSEGVHRLHKLTINWSSTHISQEHAWKILLCDVKPVTNCRRMNEAYNKYYLRFLHVGLS